jgi:hypothetical protein
LRPARRASQENGEPVIEWRRRSRHLREQWREPLTQNRDDARQKLSRER